MEGSKALVDDKQMHEQQVSKVYTQVTSQITSARDKNNTECFKKGRESLDIERREILQEEVKVDIECIHLGLI